MVRPFLTIGLVFALTASIIGGALQTYNSTVNLAFGQAVEESQISQQQQQQQAADNQSTTTTTTTTAEEDGSDLVYSAWGDTILGGDLPVTKGIALNAYLVQEQNEQGEVIDAFAYDGQGYNKIPVGITLFDVDPDNNTGRVEALWMDREGNQWRFVQTQFEGGETVFFRGVDENGEPILVNTTDPVAVNGFHHGNTAFSPSLPVVFAYLATWGPSDVWRNGEKIGTVPGHLMITNGVRDPGNWRVWADENKTAIYDPQNPSQGYADPSVAQAHVIFFPQDTLPHHLMFHDIKAMD